MSLEHARSQPLSLNWKDYTPGSYIHTLHELEKFPIIMYNYSATLLHGCHSNERR